MALTRIPTGPSSRARVSGQCDERGLARVVCARERLRPDAGDRRHVDDAAAVISHPCVDGVPGEPDRAHHVDVPDLADRALVGVEDRPELRVGRGVVDKDIEPARLAHDLSDHRLACCRVAHVPRYGERASPGGDDGCRGRVARLGVPGVECDGRPRLCEHGGDGETDPPAAAGDERHSPLEGEAVGDAQFSAEEPAWSLERASIRSSSAASRRSSRRHAARRSAVPSISSRRWRWGVSTWIAAATR